MSTTVLPLGKSTVKTRYSNQLNLTELIDKCVGSRIWVVMKGDKGGKPDASASYVGLIPSRIRGYTIGI